MKIRKGFRKLHFESDVWQYKIGRGSIVIYSPSDKKFVVSYEDMTGLDPCNVEKGIYKRWLHILPSTVKEYIRKKLI